MESWREELYHHCIKNQKWGIRHYQNPDGSLTAEGRERYGHKYRDDGTKRTSREIRRRTIDSYSVEKLNNEITLNKLRTIDSALKDREDEYALRKRYAQIMDNAKTKIASNLTDAEIKKGKENYSKMVTSVSITSGAVTAAAASLGIAVASGGSVIPISLPPAFTLGALAGGNIASSARKATLNKNISKNMTDDEYKYYKNFDKTIKNLNKLNK